MRLRISQSEQIYSRCQPLGGHRTDKESTVQNIIKIISALALAGISSSLLAASQEYVYVPVNGVHEAKTFHGCYDDDRPASRASRTSFNVIMKGLGKNDVLVEPRKLVPGKPSSELLTFRLKQRDASLTVQFLSDDGPHCQQGVASIAFTDATFHKFADLQIKR